MTLCCLAKNTAFTKEQHSRAPEANRKSLCTLSCPAACLTH